MANNWEAWSERNKEFAPVIGLHKHHLFYPTGVEAFLKEQIELMVLVKIGRNNIPIWGSIREFSQCKFSEKIQWMNNPDINNKLSYLNRFGGKVDLKKSCSLQEGEPHKVYVRGFRNTETREAYITYWFFYLENFVPRSMNDAQIEKKLNKDPNQWWTHEGDWEGISVHFMDYESSTPAHVTFSQHLDPKTRLWRNIQTQDGWIRTISAIGSHANFFEPVRKKHFAPLPHSEVASPDELIYPKHRRHAGKNTYVMEALDPKQKHLWLRFKGRWGESSGQFTPAPIGPLMKRRKHFKLLADIGS